MLQSISAVYNLFILQATPQYLLSSDTMLNNEETASDVIPA